MSDDSQFSEQVEVGWINWFCTLEDHHFFIEIDQTYIRDPSNLYGLKARVQRYDEALLMILRHRPPSEQQIDDPKFLELYQIATELYGLIHARFITTPMGLAVIREKYLAGKFGNCPRVMCENQNVIPTGMSTDTKLSRVKVYCPRCKDIYNPKKKFADIDGAFFGTAFPYLLLMTYPDLGPIFKKEIFAPTMYGFRIQEPNPETKHEHAHSQLSASRYSAHEEEKLGNLSSHFNNNSSTVNQQQKSKKNKNKKKR